MYEFGYGLSFTTFKYTDLKIEGQNVSLTVTNTGKRTGSDVVQLYLSVPETENFYGGYRSPKNLKNFFKVKNLEPSQSTTVTMELEDRAFSYFNVTQARWVKEPGTYGVLVGASSRDIRLNGEIKI